MTLHKHLKDLVRSRMAKTGESYVTARRHILKSRDPEPGLPFRHFPGNVPAATALRILLTNAGVVAPHTGRPFSEAMVFGIGGGVGAGAFSFHYAKENYSSFFIAGRHLWEDDLAWLNAACGRFGVSTAVKEASDGAAGKALAEMLASGPVIAWVDKATLPYRGMPAWAAGSGYYVLVVYSSTSSAAQVGDLADQPIEIATKDLQAARARIKKQKNRLLSIKPKGSLDLKSAVRDGIKACADRLVKARMRNFTLGAFRDFADRMHGSKSKDSWERIFPPGPNLLRGLTSINEFVEHWGTGGGLTRPLMGEFLIEASEAVGDPRLKPVAEQYAELGRKWSALAEAALPERIPALRDARARVDSKEEEFLGRTPASDAARRVQAWDPEAKADLSMTPEEADGLRRDLKTRIVELCDLEERAQKDLLRLVD